MLDTQVVIEDPVEQKHTSIFEERILYYTQWINTKTEQQSGEWQRQCDAYREMVMQPVQVNGQNVCTFAPYQSRFSALQTMTRKQKQILQLLGVAYVLSLVIYSTPGLLSIIAVLTLFYAIDLCIYCFVSVRIVGESDIVQIPDALVHALADVDWPSYTILCPLYHEVAVVPQFVQAMKALDYPVDKLQILFLTEEDDEETRDAIECLNLPSHFEIVIVPKGQPRTKPRACNYGLLKAIGEYVVIYDAEDIPDPLQLKKAILTFADEGPQTACVQAKLNYYNANQNILTRWFTAEYSAWFDMTLPGLQVLGVPLPLGGTSNHFRTTMLYSVGAWDAFNVTEDCDLGLRLGYYKLRTVVMDSTTYEEANSQFTNWMRQRSRWIKGYLQTYLVHMRYPLEYLREGRIREFLSLQLIIGGKSAILLINPLMWLLVALYFLFHTFVASAYHTLYPTPILYMGSLCLIFGNFMYIYVHLIGCIKSRQFSIVKWSLTMPLYWAMASVAAYIALYQLIFKPHYWEKTQHGLHLLAGKGEMPHYALMPHSLVVPVTPPISNTLSVSTIIMEETEAEVVD
ncbi:MAG: hypothetical protein PVS3B3_32100 [Ktedonobacteraceae bacterium]